jgi:hypothetical protein
MRNLLRFFRRSVDPVSDPIKHKIIDMSVDKQSKDKVASVPPKSLVPDEMKAQMRSSLSAQMEGKMNIVGAFPLTGKKVDAVPIEDVLAVAASAATKDFPLLVDVLIGNWRFERGRMKQNELTALENVIVSQTVKVADKPAMLALLERIRLTRFVVGRTLPPHLLASSATPVVALRLSPRA